MTEEHLARLLFEGTGSSTGHYTPQRFHVRLQGRQEMMDTVVYFHEVHHGLLNDGTAWGSLLHIYARLPREFATRFAEFLDACRMPHESFATFGSVGIAQAHFGDEHDALAAYPSYRPLHNVVRDLVADVVGQHRKHMVVEMAARVCMQTPVLDVLCECGFAEFTPAAVRAVDRPDERWAAIVRSGPGLFKAAADAADAEMARAHGTGLLDADTPDGGMVATTAATHDELWESWQVTAYRHLSAALTARTSAKVLDFAGHQAGTRAAIELGRELLPTMRLRGSDPDEPKLGDGVLAGAVIQQVRHNLHDVDRFPATCADLPLPDLVELVVDSTVIDEQPCLFVHSRLGTRLNQLYDWDDAAPLGREPLSAVRLIGDDGNGGSTIVHRAVESVGALAALHDRWDGRGPVICCTAASCLADTSWRDEWVPALPGDSLILIDVEPDRFLPHWRQSGAAVRAIRIAVDDRSRARAGLALCLGESSTIWFAVADTISIGLLTEHIRDGMGDRFDGTGRFTEHELTAVRLAITHVLATESFVGFDGLEGYA